MLSLCQFEPAATCFQAFRSVFRGKSGLLPDPTKQQQIVKLRNDGPCGSVLTTVETNQTAEIGVGCFLLHSYRVCIAHRCQVVIHHLEWALSGVQPPAGQKTRRGTLTMPVNTPVGGGINSKWIWPSDKWQILHWMSTHKPSQQCLALSQAVHSATAKHVTTVSMVGRPVFNNRKLY